MFGFLVEDEKTSWRSLFGFLILEIFVGNLIK